MPLFEDLLARMAGREPKKREAPLDLRERYSHFRHILNLNNECLARLAVLQENLAFTSPSYSLFAADVAAMGETISEIVSSLEKMTRTAQPRLRQTIAQARAEVEQYLVALERRPPRRLAASLAEIVAADEAEVGGKAAMLGEVKNRIGLPVPEGFVITTEAYRRCSEALHWREVRDTLRKVLPGAAEALAGPAGRLRALLESAPVPRAVEVAITERAAALGSGGLAVRSSAVGEAGPHSYAGQFLSLLNVPRVLAVDAYRRVLASRFSEHALAYRLAMGILEVRSPLAVLFMEMVRPRAAGILYTRNPSEPHGGEMWISATGGLGIDLAAGATPGNFLALSRKRPYRVLGSKSAPERQTVAMAEGGGIERVDTDGQGGAPPNLSAEELGSLAAAGIKIEAHFECPQDIEWAIDTENRLWILQTRRLSMTASPQRSIFSRPKVPPLAAGGQTVCPGRTSGRAWPVDAQHPLSRTPDGSVILLRRASPEVAEALPRAEGLVAEGGNLTGHAATLLREFRVPSVFFMPGAMQAVSRGQPVSLDASERKLFAGTLWPPASRAIDELVDVESQAEPIHHRVLNLSLLHTRSGGFQPGACKSLHDVLRFCHERAVEAMFSTHDAVSASGSERCFQLASDLPLNILVLDLGGATEPGAAGTIPPASVLCRPFQALWKGFTHPGVQWTREMPISFSDLTSVLAGSLSSDNYVSRALGEHSYLMVSPEYFNLNARLAYHFTLIDAALTDDAANNYVSFRFAGGGATRGRRNLRACFIEACLSHYGFQVDRRGDLVNAWLKRVEPRLLEERLDIVGRLTASTCQLDMYMSNRETMEWYVRQFLSGNYAFHYRESEDPRGE